MCLPILSYKFKYLIPQVISFVGLLIFIIQPRAPPQGAHVLVIPVTTDYCNKSAKKLHDLPLYCQCPVICIMVLQSNGC